MDARDEAERSLRELLGVQGNDWCQQLVRWAYYEDSEALEEAPTAETVSRILGLGLDPDGLRLVVVLAKGKVPGVSGSEWLEMQVASAKVLLDRHVLLG